MQRELWKMRVHFSQLFFYGKFWKVSRLYHRLRAFRGCRDLKSQILMILCVAMYHHLWYFRGYNSPNPRFWWYYASRCIITRDLSRLPRPQIPDSDDTTCREVSSLREFSGTQRPETPDFDNTTRRMERYFGAAKSQTSGFFRTGAILTLSFSNWIW